MNSENSVNNVNNVNSVNSVNSINSVNKKWKQFDSLPYRLCAFCSPHPYIHYKVVMVQKRQVPHMAINEFYNSKILQILQKYKWFVQIIVLIVFCMEILPDNRDWLIFCNGIDQIISPNHKFTHFFYRIQIRSLFVLTFGNQNYFKIFCLVLLCENRWIFFWVCWKQHKLSSIWKLIWKRFNLPNSGIKSPKFSPLPCLGLH